MSNEVKVNDQNVVSHFDKLAEDHGDVNGVLDASKKSPEVARKNIYRDFILKYSLQKWVPISSNDHILDYGCGVGRLSIWLAPKVASVEGVDISGSMIQVAKKINSHQKISYTHISGKLPFDDATFSKVITCWVLQHISDEALIETLKDIRAKMSAGSGMYIMEQISPDIKHTKDIHVQRTEADYIRLFEAAGFAFNWSKPAFRSPSYAMSIWDKNKWFPQSMMGLLGMIEHQTVNRKPEHRSYYTSLMAFSPVK
jgi:2-polyprenyl-3-methyl-5-hydroxy-6-metoxy-1,4-benzoquinol methylase